MRLSRPRLLIAFAVMAPGVSAAEPVTIFAAASLTDVMRKIEPLLGARVRFSFAASSTLARQIEQGAPAQIFISADEPWMDHLAKLGRIETASRRALAGNRLVVVGSGDRTSAAPAESVDALRAALGNGRVATGDPAHVPVGRYAEAALRSLSLWDAISPRLVRADNVRSALAFVERGEAGAGIVYATDAAVSDKVRVLARFPASSHAPIVYPAALVAGADAVARAVFERLFMAQAQASLREGGFIAVP